MKLVQEKKDGVLVVTLVGEMLDASVTIDFKADMAPILRAERHVVLDLSHVQFVDSSGVGAILSCLRTLNVEGGDLKVCSLTRPVQALFELVRMHKIFDIFETREAAIDSFQSVLAV